MSRSCSTTSSRSAWRRRRRWPGGRTRRRGAHARIITTTDRRRALDGADFAVDMIEVGGIGATRLDFDIPRKYGLRQTIADTSGVGAVSRALRTIPVLLGIAEDMTELCPDAWMLNYTNPMAMNCWAWYAGSSHQKVVGLCHSIQNTSHDVCEYAGVPFEEVTFLGAGVNHMSWVLRLERDGREHLPAAGRGDRGRPRWARPARPRPDLQALRLLPHRVERALRRVRAVVHARRRRDRAAAHPRGRVHPAQRGEP